MAVTLLRNRGDFDVQWQLSSVGNLHVRATAPCKGDLGDWAAPTGLQTTFWVLLS